MKKKLTAIYSFLLLLFYNNLIGQNIEKYRDKVDNLSFTYYALQPQSKVVGVLVLLPGSGENPKSIFEKTNLPQIMANNGYLILAPELHNSLFADQSTIKELDKICKTQCDKYKVLSLMIGGFSSGGAVAVGYAEYLVKSDTSNILKGVFTIDPPLDLTRLYASALRRINYQCKGLIMKEGYAIKGILENTLGGSPDSKPEQYLIHSSYSANDSEGGNAKYLKSIPIRLYTEPDLDFVRRTYCTDLQIDDINAYDLESLYKFLLKIGNKNVEYITTRGRGFHSWNIVDAPDCANWMMSISK
ncbi:hypothetical protein VB264_19585 [Arcicella aquatica]|uniref:Alpha/beta hydrolase n=1 Tax=Arcicella aquatica TaxID=217141 RepID=A0ABU5QT68_9BACT|nr:hypothetical protein [Arcicella aquatica]MEA5260009.1 hypothetical protein [Arcicella aquatica]